MELCPHCSGTTTTSPSRALRKVCGACGGARVPGVKLGAEGVAALRRAKSELTKERSASLVGAVLVAMSLLVAVIALVAAVTGHGGAAFGAATLAAIDFTVAMAAWAYGRKRRLASRGALDVAWVEAAAQVARRRGGEITARDLSRELETSEEDAEAILTKLSSAGARVEVDDAAQLHYRVDALDGGGAGDPGDAAARARGKAAR